MVTETHPSLEDINSIRNRPEQQQSEGTLAFKLDNPLSPSPDIQLGEVKRNKRNIVTQLISTLDSIKSMKIKDAFVELLKKEPVLGAREFRLIRIKNQHTLESSLEENIPSKTPCKQRIETVREEIFKGIPISNLQGYAANELRAEGLNTANKDYEFCNPNMLKTTIYPAFCAVIDRLSEGVATETEDHDEASIRLASVITSLGYLMHSHSDGTGQTFKEVSVSYLHELSSKYANSYFPFRVSETTNDPTNYSYDVLFPITGLSPYAYLPSKEAQKLRKYNAVTLGLPYLEQADTPQKQMLLVKKKTEIEQAFPDAVERLSLERGLKRHKEKGFGTDRSQYITSYLEYILTSEAGRNVLEQYVYHNRTPATDIPYQTTTVDMLQAHAEDIKRLLQSSQQHVEQYQKITSDFGSNNP